jgi:predicted phosphohydrolase
MALFAISDTHLSYARLKLMSIFGENWIDHDKKMRDNWLESITAEDTILLPGDISWAINYKELEPDMEFLLSLPGKKVISPGNHDYWWGSTQRLNDIYKKERDELCFLKNDFYDYNGIAICAAKGWTCPNDTYFTPQHEKLYKRETGRLKLSLDAAKNKGYERIVVMLHFPPTNDKRERSDFVELIEQYGAERVIYGHLHGEKSFNASYKGEVNGVRYDLVSADYLDFKPLKIELD